jgi:putative transposase
MRVPRIKEEGEGFYHLLSRIVDRRMVLDEKEKERFRQLMHRAGVFSGIDVLTYSILDNHFHILAHVPARLPIDDQEFARRLAALYSRNKTAAVCAELARLRETGDDDAAGRLKEPYLERMCDISAYMKTVKQRFSQSFNARHSRRGTLWEERFKSVLVEGSQGALSAVATYIDRNAVRAGIVRDPKDYRFCGYGEAVAGNRLAQKGLAMVMQSVGGDNTGWGSAHAEYRKVLYCTGQAQGLTREGTPTKPGFSQSEVDRVLASGGQLAVRQALQCRVRYFSDGLILGSRTYVDDAFLRYRDRFGVKRKSGARSIREIAWGDLCTARRLQLTPVTASVGQ